MDLQYGFEVPSRQRGIVFALPPQFQGVGGCPRSRCHGEAHRGPIEALVGTIVTLVGTSETWCTYVVIFTCGCVKGNCWRTLHRLGQCTLDVDCRFAQVLRLEL